MATCPWYLATVYRPATLAASVTVNERILSKNSQNSESSLGPSPPTLTTMRVLVACEFSGVVLSAFLEKHHDAYSCDLLPPDSKTHPDPSRHIQTNVLELLTEDQGWDLLIGHPPCTYLTSAANHLRDRPSRQRPTEQALEFFLALWNAPIPRICLENPPGIVAKRLNIPISQTTHPYHHGDPYAKTICLRLKNLPCLRRSGYAPPPYLNRDHLGRDVTPDTQHRARVRSTFFPGVAAAMADQWGTLPPLTVPTI